ncbi:MAG: WD40 repeat domain-containing protein [Myxococcota bacterium]
MKELKEHTKEIWDIAFSPDNNHIASASSDETVRVWHISKQKQ